MEIFPRRLGPFIRSSASRERELVIGKWALIPWFAKAAHVRFSSNNARFESIEQKPTFRDPWRNQQRCVIPAWSFDEPCWTTGKNIWWRFRRADGHPWGLAGLFNAWTDKSTGELVESYTALTVNANAHPMMSRMHRPDANLPVDAQDKRSVVAIEFGDVDRWLNGSVEDACSLMRPPDVDLIEAGPVDAMNSVTGSRGG